MTYSKQGFSLDNTLFSVVLKRSPGFGDKEYADIGLRLWQGFLRKNLASFPRPPLFLLVSCHSSGPKLLSPPLPQTCPFSPRLQLQKANHFPKRSNPLRDIFLQSLRGCSNGGRRTRAREPGFIEVNRHDSASRSSFKPSYRRQLVKKDCEACLVCDRRAARRTHREPWH